MVAGINSISQIIWDFVKINRCFYSSTRQKDIIGGIFPLNDKHAMINVVCRIWKTIDLCHWKRFWCQKLHGLNDFSIDQRQTTSSQLLHIKVHQQIFDIYCLLKTPKVSYVGVQFQLFFFIFFPWNPILLFVIKIDSFWLFFSCSAWELKKNENRRRNEANEWNVKVRNQKYIDPQILI